MRAPSRLSNSPALPGTSPSKPPAIIATSTRALPIANPLPPKALTSVNVRYILKFPNRPTAPRKSTSSSNRSSRPISCTTRRSRARRRSRRNPHRRASALVELAAATSFARLSKKPSKLAPPVSLAHLPPSSLARKIAWSRKSRPPQTLARNSYAIGKKPPLPPPKPASAISSPACRSSCPRIGPRIRKTSSTNRPAHPSSPGARTNPPQNTTSASTSPPKPSPFTSPHGNKQSLAHAGRVQLFLGISASCRLRAVTRALLARFAVPPNSQWCARHFWPLPRQGYRHGDRQRRGQVVFRTRAESLGHPTVPAAVSLKGFARRVP